MRLALIAGLLIATISLPALAQDSHYWTLTYGARASLLGGAVIGSVLDLSATYYNPGALPLIEDIDVVMTSTVFQYPNVWLRDLGGSERDIKSSNLSQVPVVVAGMFRVNWHGQNRVGYSVLSRQSVRRSGPPVSCTREPSGETPSSGRRTTSRAKSSTKNSVASPPWLSQML